MQMYEAFDCTQQDLTDALLVDGAVFALNLSMFEFVINGGNLTLQAKGEDPGLPIILPANAVRLLLPHREHFRAPPESAGHFAVSGSIHLGGTG